MASGMPLDNTDPVGVIYLIMTSDDDGRVFTPTTAILGKTEAEKFVGTDSRRKAVPMLTFATANAAKTYKQGAARQKVLGKLTEVEQIVLFGSAIE